MTAIVKLYDGGQLSAIRRWNAGRLAGWEASRFRGSELRVQSPQTVQGSGFRVQAGQGPGSRVQGREETDFGFRIANFEFERTAV